MKKDCASAVFSRLRAATVKSGHPLFDECIDQGLKTTDSILLVGPSGIGKTEWCYYQAATQLCAGGRVKWIQCLASSIFDVSRFLCHVETALCHHEQLMYSDLVKAMHGIEGLKLKLKELLSRMEVCHCLTILELLGTLNALSTSSASSSSKTVPLLILDGLGVPSGFHYIDRALKMDLPLVSAIQQAVQKGLFACLVTLSTWPQNKSIPLSWNVQDLLSSLTSPWQHCIPPASFFKRIFLLSSRPKNIIVPPSFLDVHNNNGNASACLEEDMDCEPFQRSMYVFPSSSIGKHVAGGGNNNGGVLLQLFSFQVAMHGFIFL